MSDLHMLTTIDNPFDPVTQWDEWFAEDMRLGYNTPGLLARMAVTSDELSELDQDLAIEEAIDNILRLNVLGVLTKVKVPNQNSEE